MIIGNTKAKIRKCKLNQIQRGWHDWFAWFPTKLQGGGIAWLEKIERKFYTTAPTVKKGLNEDQLYYWQQLEKMYRRKESEEEQVVYYRENGTPYVDPNEV